MIDNHLPARAPETIASLATDPERFNTQRDALRRYCYAFLRNEHDAEDAVQLTLERALRYGTVHKDGGRWLIAIARNVCRDLLAARRGESPLPDDDGGIAATYAFDPEHEVTTRRLLAGALESLTPTERRAVGASWVLDQTSYDAARSVGIAHQTLRVHLARARKKLALYIETAERATAGFAPWLWSLPHRALRREASWADRLVTFSAPALALAVTVASVAVVAEHRGAGVAGKALATAPITGLALHADGFGTDRAQGSPDSGAPAAASSGIVHSLQSVLSPGRQQDAYVSDFQPSPSYSQDHTLFASATDSACQGNAECGELFVSRDAGHTWTNLNTVGLQPFAQLLLPPSSYAAGEFYAFGPGGLQITKDGGKNFLTLVNDLPGYAGLMPPGESSYVSVANVDLWNFAALPAPGLEGAYAGPTAIGSAVPVLRPTGWVLLQPAKPAGGAEELLSCGGGGVCATGAQLPWATGPTELDVSPDGMTVVALNAFGVAVSHDYGASFAPSAIPAGLLPYSAAVGGGRIVLVASNGKQRTLLTSADGGSSWRSVTGLPATGSPNLVRWAGGGFELELVRSSNPESLLGFYTSADGASWRAS